MAIFIFSCGDKKDSSNGNILKEKTEEITQTVYKESNVEVEIKKKEEPSEKNAISKCKCFDGIGSTDKDEPILTLSFSNGKSISVCGYKNPDSKTDKLLISEFNVFDCLDGSQLVQYGAMDNCILETKKDLLKIYLLKHLPVGENWKWKPIKIAEQKIIADSDKLKISEIVPSFKPVKINKVVQISFLDNLKEGEGFGGNWEENIGKLEVLSLNGNERAWNILKDYETFTGEKTDGALAEMWKEAIATVKWITDKK